MGQPKEGVRLADGRPMATHVLDALAPLGVPIALLGESQGWTPPESVVQLTDRTPGKGPLGGLDTLLHWGRAHVYLVVCCDQPLLGHELVRFLADHAHLCEGRPLFLQTESGQTLDPFPCLLPSTLAGDIALALREDRLGVRRLLSHIATHLTIPDAWAPRVASMNDREALRQAGLLHSGHE